MPVARATASHSSAADRAGVGRHTPAHSRRARSSMVAFSRRHFWRTNFSASTENVDHVGAILSIPTPPAFESKSIDLSMGGP